MVKAVYPDSETIDTLAGALSLRARRKAYRVNMHFGSGIYRSCPCSTALGKAGDKLGHIDHFGIKPFAYLNTFKGGHYN